MTLKTELTDDPLARGYSGMTDEQAAADLNSIYPAPDTRTRPRASMTSSEIWQSVDIPAYKLLLADKQDNIKLVMSFGVVDPFGKEADIFIDAFGAGSATITALQAARQEIVSRAMELGLGIVTEGDVWDVRNGNQ